MDGVRVPLTAAGTRLSIATITSGFDLSQVKLELGRSADPHNMHKLPEQRWASDWNEADGRLDSHRVHYQTQLKEKVHENKYAGHRC